MKGHNGYYGCFVCLVKGDHMDHRMVFPQTKRANWPIREQNDINVQIFMVVKSFLIVLMSN